MDEHGQNHCVSVPRSLFYSSGSCSYLWAAGYWKIIPRWAGRGTNSTGYAGLVKGSEFPLEELPASATETCCATSKSGGQEEMVLKLLRNASRCGIQNENPSGFLGRSKSIQANLISLCPNKGKPVESRTQRNCKRKGCPWGLPKISFLKLLTVVLCSVSLAHRWLLFCSH